MDYKDGSGGRTFVVRTPEQVHFRYELAGPAERLMAWLVDGAIVIGLWVALASAIAQLGAVGTPLLFVLWFLLQWGYFAFTEWRGAGASPGKRALGLRVIERSGVRPGLERLVLRNFLRVVDALPVAYALGGLCALLDREGRRLGDLAAGTLVVRVPPAGVPGGLAEIRARHNSLRADPAARARVRQVLSSRERELLLALATRRPLLSEAAALRLFARAAAHLRRRLRLPPAFEGLPDERLVLNVTAVVLEDVAL